MKAVVVKIGGGILENPSIVEDLAELQKEGVPLVVVHGGASEVTRWLFVIRFKPTALTRAWYDIAHNE